MGGFFGTISKSDCVTDLYYGTDYHSHLGTKKGGMAVINDVGIKRGIHNLENSYFRINLILGAVCPHLCDNRPSGYLTRVATYLKTNFITVILSANEELYSIKQDSRAKNPAVKSGTSITPY